MKIYCSNPYEHYKKYKKEIDKAISNVLKKGRYILGEQVHSFEKEFSKYINVNFGIAVASGTDALYISLKACGIGIGDEVITVSHTAVATVAAIELCGAQPVLVDIDPNFFTIDFNKVEKAITKKTKAIIPVHIYGQPADLKPILKIASKYKLKIIEDCCQSHGALYNNKKVGSLGDIGCFSFYPTKNLGAVGDGGIIVTNNKILAKKCRLLKEYGWRKHYISEIAGSNSRLDELQAAILRVKLKYLDKGNQQRIKIAKKYFSGLANLNIILPKTKPETQNVYHLFVIRSKKRNQLKKYLELKGIYPLIHYPIPIHLQPAYINRIKISEMLTETESAAKEILSLPIYPELTENQFSKITKTIRDFHQK